MPVRDTYLLGHRVLLPVGERGAGGLLHPSETRAPNVGAGHISLAIEHNHLMSS